MNHIPKFLISHKKRNKMNNNNKGPKLERRLALRKNIEYDPPDSATCQSLRTRSLDLAPNNSSFRIHGIQDGEIDMIFQSLGLSPDDFAIPVASWEAHKARSASNVLPRVRQDESERGREREREILGQKPGLDDASNSVGNYATMSSSDVSSGKMSRERERKTLCHKPGLDVRNDETCTEREREGGRERKTLAEKQGLELLNSDSVVNDATRSNFDARSDETCRERERGTLSEKRGLDLLNRCEDGEVVASNDRFVAVDGNTRSVLDVREREILGERGFSEEIVTNKTRSISDVSNDGMLSEKRDHYLLNSFDDREVVASNDRFVVVDGNTRSVLDVSSQNTCSQRERETLGETCVAGLSNMFKDSVRVSDQVVTNNDQFNVSPIVVSNASSMFDISRGDVNRNPCAITESIDHCSTSRGEIKGLSIDNPSLDCGDHNNVGVNVTKFANIGSMGGIKGVRPPLLAPPPSISARVIDNTSSTWDIMRSFAPDSEENPSPVRERSSYYDDEEEREARLRGSAAFLSESCSFTTTSNDDDSSSSTTEPMSNISPNGRFKRVITYWEKGELLGRGSFGTVYEGIADGGYFIAIKEVSLLDQGDMGRQSIYQLEQEIALLSQFENENIVQYLGTDKDEAHLYIFLELVTKGSLLSLYQKYHLRDSQVSSYTRQILHGLKYLHERNVVHRDIKCANILVGADGSVKLADFGLAKATKLNDVKSCKGTAFWMAPEVVRGRHQGYGLPADIWSLGCTVLEMLTRRIPYSPLECMPALFRIGRGEPPPIPDSLSRDARDFISRCLKVDPNDRPTATQLLEHSFVRRPLSTSSGSSSPYHHPIGRGLNFSSK